MNNFKSHNPDEVLEYNELEKMVQTPEAQAAIEEQFAAATTDLNDGLSRRRWLQIMGASLALGSATGCRFQEEKIAPYVFRPHNRIPGETVKYATMVDVNGVANSLLATSFDGRPIKMDGNIEHPDSLGGSSAYTQGYVLELYDPDRLRNPMVVGDKEAWDESTPEAFMEAARGLLNKSSLSGVAILSEPNSSPTLARLRGDFEAKGGKWFEFTSVTDDNTRAGAKLAFGDVHRAHYHFDKAKVIVTLDCDFLGIHPSAMANSRKFTEGRDVDHEHMNRMYCIETQFTQTGGSSDHRMSLPTSKIASFAAALKTAVASASAEGHLDASLPYREKLLAAMAQDLKKYAGKGIVLAGESQPPEVHALVHALNQELGNNGKTITFTKQGSDVQSLESIKLLCDDISAGSVETLVVLGGNPVFSAPGDFGFDEKLSSVKNAIHLTVYRNETSLKCGWNYNLAHSLECWADGLAYDGSWCIAQPLIRPLFGGMSPIEVLASVMSSDDAEGLGLLQETAKANLEGDFDNAWAKAVHLGFVEGSAAEAASVSAGAAPEIADDGEWLNKWSSGKVELSFTPSRSVYDGRHSNNAWLQELPDFITKITWDNAALVNTNTAAELGLKHDHICKLKVDGKDISMPVCVTPGTADGSIVVALGYGRTAAGRVGGDELKGIDSVGHNVASVRSARNWWSAADTEAINSGTFHRLAMTQEPWLIDKTGRDEIQDRMFVDNDGNRSRLIREGTWTSYESFMKEHAGDHDHDDHAKAAPQKDPSALPVITNVGFTTLVEDEEDHEHGHGKAQWPEGFGLHHENKDLTPGVRQRYTQENKEYTNVWGMGIDLNKCTGCNSCVIACQAENNIPVVGKWQVDRGREMHWMRIDRYFGDNLYNQEAAENDDKQITHQPVTCHHCENAPCETVCPVAATVHSTEGLNDMVYNRCIGTRYCGNNCPYKVRRFNFLNYSEAVTFIKYPGPMAKSDLAPHVQTTEEDKQLQNLMVNPEVTIRSRGVMEKCTYCVQRIQNTKIKAKAERREIGANEITVACQDACPANAITFGDLNNSESNVAKAHGSSRAYTMLEELNNWPRTQYLARVRNPHPDLVDLVAKGHDHDHDEKKATADH
jgi:molybdopterin-containing oxidoreductase family iron-sulfur binding subunit